MTRKERMESMAGMAELLDLMATSIEMSVNARRAGDDDSANEAFGMACELAGDLVAERDLLASDPSPSAQQAVKAIRHDLPVGLYRNGLRL